MPADSHKEFVPKSHEQNGELSPEQKELNFEHELDMLQARIGYRFKNRLLLVQAMTSPAFSALFNSHNSASNKPLERYGDTVLAEKVERWTRATKHIDERDALERSVNSNAYLAIVGKMLDLDLCVRVTKREVQATEVARKNHQKTDREMVQIRLISNAFEALIGAIAIDGGTAASDAFIEHFVLPRPDAHEKIQNIEKLFAGGLEDVRSAFSELTFGRGTLETQEAPDGSLGVTLKYHDEPVLFVYGKNELGCVRSAAVQFFFSRPWAFWGGRYHGPVSHLMPSSSDTPYGKPIPRNVKVEDSGKKGRGGRILWKIARRPVAAVAKATEKVREKVRDMGAKDEWPPYIPAPIQRYSSAEGKGPYMDQLRLKLQGQGELAITSPDPKAKNARFAFYLDGTHLMTITGATGPEDAARQMLEEIRKSKNGKKRRRS